MNWFASGRRGRRGFGAIQLVVRKLGLAEAIKVVAELGLRVYRQSSPDLVWRPNPE